jgi:hypothetical protein
MMRARCGGAANACSNWTRAYCEQHHDFARLLTRLATEVFAHAKDVEKNYVPYPARLDALRRRHRV